MYSLYFIPIPKFHCKCANIFDDKIEIYKPCHLSQYRILEFLNYGTYLAARFLDQRLEPTLDNTTTSGHFWKKQRPQRRALLDHWFLTDSKNGINTLFKDKGGDQK